MEDVQDKIKTIYDKVVHKKVIDVIYGIRIILPHEVAMVCHTSKLYLQNNLDDILTEIETDNFVYYCNVHNFHVYTTYNGTLYPYKGRYFALKDEDPKYIDVIYTVTV